MIPSENPITQKNYTYLTPTDSLKKDHKFKSPEAFMNHSDDKSSKTEGVTWPKRQTKKYLLCGKRSTGITLIGMKGSPSAVLEAGLVSINDQT